MRSWLLWFALAKLALTSLARHAGEARCLLQQHTSGKSQVIDGLDSEARTRTPLSLKQDLHGANSSWRLEHSNISVPLEGSAEHEGSAGHKHNAEDKHKHATKASPTIGLVLLGTVAVVMTLFYLVNYPDIRIVRATWLLLSSALSIFGAVIIFETIKSSLFGQEEEGHEAGGHPAPPTLEGWLWKVGLFFFISTTFYWLLDRTHETPWMFEAIGVMGAHVVGFAAINVFGNLQQFELFASSPYLAIGEAFASLVCMLTFLGILDYLLNILLKGEMEHKFQHQTHESENEAAGLMFGLLLSQVIKFFITGEMPPLHGDTTAHSSSEIVALFVCSMVMLTLVATTDMARREVAARGMGVWMVRTVEITETVIAFGSSWCLLSCGNWLFYKESVGKMDENVHHMVVFLAFAVAGFVAIFFLDSLEDRGILGRVTIESLVGSVGLLLGISWEACMITAVSGIEDVAPEDYRVSVTLLTSAFLAVLVVPAWAMYILPKEEEYQEEREQELEKAIEQRRSEILESEKSASPIR